MPISHGSRHHAASVASRGTEEQVSLSEKAPRGRWRSACISAFSGSGFGYFSGFGSDYGSGCGSGVASSSDPDSGPAHSQSDASFHFRPLARSIALLPPSYRRLPVWYLRIAWNSFYLLWNLVKTSPFILIIRYTVFFSLIFWACNVSDIHLCNSSCLSIYLENSLKTPSIHSFLPSSTIVLVHTMWIHAI